MYPNADEDPLDLVDSGPVFCDDEQVTNEDHDNLDDEDELDVQITEMLFGVAHATSMVLNAAASQALQVHSKTHYEKVPYHTSALSGMAWVNELLTGHPDRIRSELGVCHHVFYTLLNLLRDVGFRNSKHITLEEQLAIFLYGSVTGLSICHLGEHFQHSNEMISKYFKCILNAFSSPPIYTTYVRIRLPDEDSPIPPEITLSPKFYPYFADAIGAIGSTHISCHPSSKEHHTVCNRKGTSTQNCLATCSFDMSFLYMLSGWKGSAVDAHITDFAIPAGKYYLADAGFASFNELLVPYHGVCYHLSEWGCANVAPCNHKELFNLQHAMLRNVIEHIFVVLKNRFKILLLPPNYAMDVQIRIPSALCLVHNVIRVHDPNDMLDFRNLKSESYNAGTLAEGPPSEEACAHAQERRDTIAHQMWADYNLERQRRGWPIIEEVLS